ncbi:peptidylprolyl isomerase fpr3, partial [Coemansia sp. RSA 1286]
MYRGFWGLTIVPGKTYSQVVDMPFRLSNAALDTTIESNTRTSVLLTVDEKPFVLCSLTPGSIEQQTVDITLSEGENITFETQGDNIIHLTGNFVYDMDEPSSDEDDDDDEEEMDLSDVSPEELREMIEEGLIDPRVLMGEGESDEEDDSDYDSDDAEVDGRIREITDEEEAELVAEVEEEEEVPVKEVKIKKQAEKKRKADQAAEKKEAASSKKSKQAEKTEKTEKKAEKKAEKAEKNTKTKSKDCGGGVMADIMKEGDGQGAKNGQRVGMYYIGKLTNGK